MNAPFQGPYRIPTDNEPGPEEWAMPSARATGLRPQPATRSSRSSVPIAEGNFEIALKAEAKKVIRNFQPYNGEQRANHAASHRLGHRQRVSDGHHFYTHPDIPNRAFDTRGAAARAALQVQS